MAVTKRALYYLKLYSEGWTMEEIAKKVGRNKSTISRTIRRAQILVCPFSHDCLKCPLDDCAFNDKYAFLVNNNHRNNYRRYYGGRVSSTHEINVDPQDEV